MLTNTHKKFLNPKTVLFQAGLKSGEVVADLGTGSGFYSLAAAEIVGGNGQVHAADVKDSALDHLAAEARLKGMKVIRTYHCDLDEEELACKVPEGECDMVVMANIMHEVESRKNLIKHGYGMLKTGGRLLIVDWNGQPGPIGPQSEKRISEGETRKLLESSSFKFIKNIETDEYHFGMVFER
ncbi:MAG: class I SAM-dependent methyltransferase [Candidatus Doudnabacteria bacterium]|nr:class I SAM-dependent methyltransferase [Candidatus Doudnabacteria bacterium]